MSGSSPCVFEQRESLPMQGNDTKEDGVNEAAIPKPIITSGQIELLINKIKSYDELRELAAFPRKAQSMRP